MCKDTDLTDKIFTAWKAGNWSELERLNKEVPQGYSVCVVNPAHVHPTVIMVRDDEIGTSVEGIQLKLDGSETRKRTLVTLHGQG